MAKRQNTPELPETIFSQAKLAWENAVREDEADRADRERLWLDLMKLHAFRRKVDKAYNSLPDTARAHIDPDLEFYREYKVPSPAGRRWINILHHKIDELNYLVKRRPGDNQITDTGINLIGLRAFARVLRDYYLLEPERRWSSSGSGTVGAGGERSYSPAERFLCEHAKRVDPTVTIDHARTVVKKPYSDK